MYITLSKKGLRLHYRNKKGQRRILYLGRLLILIALIGITLTFAIKGISSLFKEDSTKLSYKEVSIKDDINNDTIILPKDEKESSRVENVDIQQEVEEPKIDNITIQEEQPKSMSYRLTSYYTGDGTNSTTVTASGKTTNDFQINENGWYTYQGKLVVATASERLLSWDIYKDSTQVMYDLYEELTLTIDGVDYDAIILDVCGAAMREPRIDLFVSSPQSVKDTNIMVTRK